jgi:hypothetical protein
MEQGNPAAVSSASGARPAGRARPAIVGAPCALALHGALLLGFALGGCASLGPATVVHDRANYISAVAESWKEQTLMNVVRMRYGDAPSFVDVSSVISSYSFQGQLSAAGQFNSGGAPATFPSSVATVNGTAAYVDRPTITYTPVAGDKFARSLLRPIPPSAIFDLIQAGYPSDRILQLTARAINGVYNRSTLGQETREADPEFYEILGALRRLQFTGAVAMRIEKRAGEDVGVLVFSRKQASASNADYQLLIRELGIRPDAGGEITLTFGAQARGDKEIALLSRSMLGILLEVANGIDVPGADVSRGRAGTSGRRTDASDPHDRPIIRILSGSSAPADAYAAVHYRGAWYWIRDDDLASKTTFSFLMMFFSLAETGVVSAAPVVTIPAN